VIWLIRLVIVVAIVGAITAAYEGWRSHVYGQGDAAGAARVQKRWDEERLKLKAAEADDLRASLAETKRRMERQQENDRVHQQKLAAVQRDRDAARGVALRLSERINAAESAARRAAADSTASADCKAAAASSLLHAQLLRRADARAGELAEYADRARIAGEQCAADYDALTTRP
jgi:hypothetical protein